MVQDLATGLSNERYSHMQPKWPKRLWPNFLGQRFSRKRDLGECLSQTFHVVRRSTDFLFHIGSVDPTPREHIHCGVEGAQLPCCAWKLPIISLGVVSL